MPPSPAMACIAGPSRVCLPRCLPSSSSAVLPILRRTSLARPTPFRPAGRHFATNPTSDDRKGFRISYLFGGLVGLGMLVTIYGLLEYYSSLQTWPEPVRTPLKAALKAKYRGDCDRSEQYFRNLDPDPLLKLSGIYIALAAMLESQGSPTKAFGELQSALGLFGSEPLGASASSPLTGRPSEKDHIRAIGLSQKLGQMALQIGSMSIPPAFPPESPTPMSSGSASSAQPAKVTPKSWDEAAEHYLSSALTAMLKLGLQNRRAPAMSPGTLGQVVAGRDVDLPEATGEEGRVDKRGLGMTMESLAEVYARKGKWDLAAQLLLQAVSILLPPESVSDPALRDRCQAALLMTTISSHALHPRSAQAVKTSRSWSTRALELAEQAINEKSPDPAVTVCERAKSVGLHNLGMLAEIDGDLTSALRWFKKALQSARDTGFAEGRRDAMDAIRRVQIHGGADEGTGYN